MSDYCVKDDFIKKIERRNLFWIWVKVISAFLVGICLGIILSN